MLTETQGGVLRKQKVTRLKIDHRLPFPKEFRQNSRGTGLIVTGEEQMEGEEGEPMRVDHVLKCVPKKQNSRLCCKNSLVVK